MLSDTCFEMIEEILDAITRYGYSDDYMERITKIIMLLNEIRDDLDHCSINNEATEEKLLKNNKRKSLRSAQKMIDEAVSKRNETTFRGFDN